MKPLGKETNAVLEIKELAAYVAGFAASQKDGTLANASKWLHELSDHVCSEGFIGCKGGEGCKSDHK